MADKKKSVFGIYTTVVQAEAAVDALVGSGFSNADVSVLLPDNESSREFAHEKHTKAPEGDGLVKAHWAAALLDNSRCHYGDALPAAQQAAALADAVGGHVGVDQLAA